MKSGKTGMIFGIRRSYLVYGVLFLILLNAAHYGFTHYEGPSLYGDDPNYLYLASSVVNGNYRLSPGYIFSLRLMQFGPIALFYKLFGVTTLTSSLWDIFSYLGIIVAVSSANMQPFAIPYDRSGMCLNRYLFLPLSWGAR